MADTARVREVGLRDGLQMVSTVLATEQKLQWIRACVAVGLHHVEITSLVPPRLVPQFADAEALVRAAADIPGLQAAVLIPNLKGAERALQLGVPKMHYVLSASNAHNLKNVRRSTAESLADFQRVVACRNALHPSGQGSRAVIGGGIATAFGCTLEGEVDASAVLRIVATLLEMGAQEITVADTVGYAHPRQVKALMRAVLKEAGGVPVAVHFHDTRGLALANIVAALEAGVRDFDACIGGLGGCPFAPNATGNVNTEDTVYLLELMGLTTGVDLSALLRLRKKIETWLPGERFSGAIAQAGLPKQGLRRALAEDLRPLQTT